MDDAPAERSGRDWTRVGIVASCILVAVALAILMPAFATDGLAGSPIDRVLPGDGSEVDGGGGGDWEGGEGGGLGALNPGAGTGVGGEVGLDSDTYGSTDTELHFTVESSEGAYWRTAAFSTYTGSGWERSTDTDPVEGSIDHPGSDGDQIDYEVTLEQSATGVPTAYRPAVVEGIDDPQVTEAGAIQVDSPLEPGTTYEGVSFAPPDDVDRLRSAGENYPTEIEQRYTQLPDDTPDRVEDRTADVIEDADADDPYEKAVAIQEYLRTSKEYDLDVSERDDSIADTFIFEMDAGYCEYFATAMTAMLRTHDIPARYVVGYSTGQEVEDGVYEVRAMNAHAWVEVYFEDIGWVQFDPTPGSERLETQEEALEELDEEFEFSEPGSPGEEFEPGENNGDDPGQGLETSLNQTAVPGETVELTVTYDTEPIPGLEVLFNGDPVGITDSDGTVVGTVPDADELIVGLQPGDDTTPVIFEELIFGEQHDDADREPRPGDHDEPAAIEYEGSDGMTVAASGGVPTPAVLGTDDTRSDRSGTGSDDEPGETHDIERTISLVTSDDPAPGSELLITARIDDVIIDGATVTVDGETVGTTNESGQIAVELPERTGEVTIAAERGSLSGEESVTIPELSMDVETGTLGSTAFESATVSVEIDDEPAAGVPVFVDGEEVAVTGSDGTATVTLPFAFDATISVNAGGQSERTTLGGLLYIPIAGGLILTGILVSVGYFFYQRGIDRRRLFERILSLPGQVVHGTQVALATVATNGDAYLSRAAARIRTLLLGVAGVLTGKVSPGEAWSGLKSRISNVWRRVVGLIPAAGSDSASGDDSGHENLTVQEAWGRFLDSVTVDSVTTSTPGEIADHAVEEDELPEGAVRKLRDAFREVEYGSRPDPDRLDSIQAALERIENANSSSDEAGD